MKKTLVVLTLLLMPLGLFAQCKKTPGQSGTFTWSFAVTDEPKISGFRVYQSAIQSGPFNNLTASAASTSRALAAPITFATGTIKTFYVVRSYFTSGGGTVESADSNSVECEQSVPSPTGLQVN
jgi:hypothetical protein